jgi:hypothetical protein
MTERTYAQDTSVPIDRTRAEIEKLVRKHGANGFVSGWDNDRATVQFRKDNRHIRFILMIPKNEQLQRARWRALLLVIKAKLEAVAAGIATFESEFLANVVLPDGRTVYEATKDKVAVAYDGGHVPPMLPDYSK